MSKLWLMPSRFSSRSATCCPARTRSSGCENEKFCVVMEGSAASTRALTPAGAAAPARAVAESAIAPAQAPTSEVW